MDAIHSMILDDRIISAKKIAENLAISRERVGYIIHWILDEKALSQMGSQMSQCCSEV
jgi:predicted regulator of amino acid metabolism with ACT domain